ncbi:MviN-like protein [compost metagenome]
MLPRISNEFAKGRLEKVNDYIYKSINFVSIISIPMAFGMASIAKEFVGWFLPQDFYKCAIVIPTLSFIIIFIAWSNVLGIQYMLPSGLNKEFTISVTIGAVVNLILNLFLIPRFQSVGAGISTFISEATVTIIQIYVLRKKLKFLNVISEILKYIVAGLFMVILVRIIGNNLGISIFTTLAQITLGGIAYLIMLIIIRSSFIMEVYKMLRSKFKLSGN